MKARNALLAAAMLALPAGLPFAADAQPVSGVYVGAGVGWNQPQETRLRAGGFGTGNAIFDPGIVALGSVGWGFGNGFRVEVEGNYRNNSFNKIKGFSPFLWGHSNAGGIQETWGVMTNVFYDFDLASFGLGPSLVQPYIGAGVGYAWNNWHHFRGVSAGTPAGIRVLGNDTKGAFAYQAIAGVAFPMTQFGVPGLSLTAEYRFFGTEDTKHNVRVFDSTSGVQLGGSRVKAENFNHSVLIGLRYAFNQPAPPPPPAVPAPAPAPAAAPARTYLVFFDWDRADLTARAREIIAEAAQNSRRMQVTRIEVAGHADRSGDANYNQRLSQRRAEAVAAELVRNGVNRSEITVQAFGESRPLVPTADGVREPQNRRVEIVLR